MIATSDTATTNAHPDPDDYAGFLASIRTRFATFTGPLFTTDAEGLWEAFLDALPPEQRQHHTCNACRRFVESYGGLVSIKENGRTVPALWGSETAQDLYVPAVVAMHGIVARAKVTGVHLSSDRTWGLPVTGAWRHMAVVPTAVYRGTALKNAGQAAAEKREDYGTVCRALAEFSPDVVAQAVTLLQGEVLYRGDKFLGVAKWLANLHAQRAEAKASVARDNVTWLAVASAPAGFCHVKSTAIGTLLADLAAGLPLASVKARFKSIMDPTVYGHAQNAPTANQIVQAERTIDALGVAPALPRRYARLDEARLLWRPVQEKTATATGGVFASVRPRVDVPPAPTTEMPGSVTMTWEKFARVVLPDARSIEVRVPASPERFAALVTAVNPDAPPMLQWDHEDARNPVSWYYHGGIDAEFRKRVVAAGGKYDDCDIRATLIWNNRNDLDLHVVTPNGEHVYYGNKTDRYGGFLDVDMNVRGETTAPVENIRWPRGKAPAGRYQVYVQNYRFHEVCNAPSPFRVEIEVGGETWTVDGVAGEKGRIGSASNIAIATIDYKPGQRVERPANASSTASGREAWGLPTGGWAKVTGICPSPNLWDEARAQRHHGRHMFFLLDGCRDDADGKGRGMFVETLRDEMREARRTLEAFLKTAPIEGATEATACGIGMTDQRPWNLTVRVTPKSGPVVTYLLDRWD